MENVDCNQPHGLMEVLVHREMDLGKSGIWISKTQLWGVHYSGLRCGDTKQCTTSKQDRHKHSTKSMGVSK
jgi:hypothetical protein